MKIPTGLGAILSIVVLVIAVLIVVSVLPASAPVLGLSLGLLAVARLV